MQIEFKDTEDSKILETNESIQEPIQPDSQLMEMIVQYTGMKFQPADEQVNLQMIISTLAEEFPSLILALSEEQFVRGYEQALEDVEAMRIKMEENVE